ncbi:MAG TPA: efflux RND transporter periplasmic adaptor subunit [Azonexus sp.]|nr:efflux RND transporter periplasmic adaptor subunit [Azonexus sp.]
MPNPNALPRRFAKPLLLAVLVSATLTLAACSKSEAPPKTGGAMPVTVLEMQPRSVPNAVEIVAQTEGAKETEVRARVGGILMKQLYQEGMPVKAGQPLFQIDRAPYEIAHAEAKAKADQATRELARLKKLVDIQGVSRKEYDDAISANELAQAALRQAQLNLSWTTITAPVDGVSGRAAKSVGNLVTVGSDSLLTSVYQNDPMWVRFSISTNEATRLPGGRLTPDVVTGVELVLPDGSVFPVKGKLNFLASTIDPTLGTRQLRAEFKNTEGRLLPGQFVRIRLLAGEQGGIFLVPQSAVIQSEQGNLVMTADAENKVAPRPVQTGEWFGKDWIVLDGLKAGDKVIVDNLMKLKPGAPVDPHPPAPPAGAPAADAAKPVQK